MTIFFSPSASGFFDAALHRAIPEDAIAVSEQRHAELLAAQADGMVIVMADGAPEPVDPPPPCAEAQVAIIRAKRDRLLEATDKLVTVPDFPISQQQRDEVLPWRAALRALPETLDPAAPFDSCVWPPRPDWLDALGGLAPQQEV